MRAKCHGWHFAEVSPTALSQEQRLRLRQELSLGYSVILGLQTRKMMAHVPPCCDQGDIYGYLGGPGKLKDAQGATTSVGSEQSQHPTVKDLGSFA